jgi:hypothetical protein
VDGNVRFGSLADIERDPWDVRFTSKSGQLKCSVKNKPKLILGAEGRLNEKHLSRVDDNGLPAARISAVLQSATRC